MVVLLVDNKYRQRNDYKGFKSPSKWLKQKKVPVLKICEATENYSNDIAEFLYESEK